MTRVAVLRACLFALALGASTAGRASPGAVDVDELLTAFAEMDGLEARFVEEKRLKLLKSALRSEGRLYFVRPGYLLRRIESPHPSKVLITPETLIVEDGSRREVIDLRARREVRFFVGSFVALLAGDKAALSDAYRISSSRGADGRWTMTLSPLGPPLSQIIRKVEVTGRGLAVEKVHVFDTNGDETVTRMLEVDPKRRFDDAERESLFGIESP